jgi:hypothetical protein
MIENMKKIMAMPVVLLALSLGGTEAAVTMTASFDKSTVLNADDEGIVTVTMTATATEGESLGDFCLVANPKVYGPCEDAASCNDQKNLMVSQGWTNQSADYMALSCGSDGVATFTTAGWPDGDYTFLASIHDAAQVPGPGVLPAYHAKAWIVADGGSPPGLTIDRANIIAKKREAVVAQSAVLQALIDQARRGGRDTAYPRAALAVVKRTLRFEPFKRQGFEFVGGDPSKKLLLPTKEEALVDMERCLGILQNTIADMKRGKELKVPTPNMKHLTIKGSLFYSGKDPVLLNGPVGWIHMWEDLDRVLELGFNVIDDEVAASATEFRATMMPPGNGGEKETFFQRERANATRNSWKLLEAKGANTALLFNPSIGYVPAWVYEHYPETKPNDELWWDKHVNGGWWGGYIYAPLESPNIRKLWAKFYEGIIPMTRDEPHLLLYWLKNEPRYWSRTPMYLEQFRACMQKKYESVAALNAVWGTSFKTFAAVEWPEEDNKPAHYDWVDFHHDGVSDFFEWQRAQVKKHAPNAATSNKPQASFMWLSDPPEDVGIDFEAQAELYEVPGFDSTQAFGDTTDTVKFLTHGGNMLLDFWTSVVPNKPLANLEQHQMPPGASDDTPPLEYKQPADVVFRFIQLTNWQQFLHGVRLNTFWFWFNKMDAGGHRPITMQPTVLYANSKSALDLRRLARYVARFPVRSEIAIYFSKPSLFLDAPNYAPTLKQVYAGLYFLDTPVGFVTDKMLSKGIDKNIKLLVIPQAKYVADEVYQAIERYAKTGRKLVVVDSSSLTRNEKNQPRQIASLLKRPNVTVQQSGQSLKQIWQEFDGLLDESGVNRPVRVIDKAGKSVWEMECRTVKDGNRRLIYLINMSQETQEVSLKTAEAIGRAKDLIADEPVSVDALLLKSFDVKFLEVE